MQKLIPIILFVFLAFLLIGIAFFWTLSLWNNSTFIQDSPETPSLISPIPDKEQSLVSKEIVEQKILESSVAINNGSYLVTENGSLSSSEAPAYSIYYYPESSYLRIVIKVGPFEEVRAQAEETLLTLLGLSPADICQLNASVSILNEADATLSGKNFPLHFCTTLSE